jgi:hypothetical protein
LRCPLIEPFVAGELEQAGVDQIVVTYGFRTTAVGAGVSAVDELLAGERCGRGVAGLEAIEGLAVRMLEQGSDSELELGLSNL